MNRRGATHAAGYAATGRSSAWRGRARRASFGGSDWQRFPPIADSASSVRDTLAVRQPPQRGTRYAAWIVRGFRGPQGNVAGWSRMVREATPRLFCGERAHSSTVVRHFPKIPSRQSLRTPEIGT